jgi:hypothetical protein
VRIPHSSLPILLGLLVAGCNPTAPTQPDASVGAGSFATVEAADARCTLTVHAILREAGSTATVGQVQFRVDPPEAESDDATVQYRGVYGPAGGLTFEVLSVGILSRLPGQGPTWTDIDKSDPGTTLGSVLEFGRVAPMSHAMAFALVDDPSSFKAVVNVVGASGGREAEGVVEPSRDAPESLRELQRLCFMGG